MQGCVLKHSEIISGCGPGGGHPPGELKRWTELVMPQSFWSLLVQERELKPSAGFGTDPIVASYVATMSQDYEEIAPAERELKS